MRSAPRSRWILAALPAFVVGATFGFGKIVRDCALTCNVGYELAPLAIIAIAALSVPVSSIQVRLSERFGFRRWHLLSTGLVALSFLAFWLLAHSVIEQHEGSIGSTHEAAWRTSVQATYLAFFVWLGAAGTLLGPNIKSVARRIHDEHHLGRALAVSAGAVMLGGFVSSYLASVAVPFVAWGLHLRYEHARDTLIIGMGALMLLGLPAFLLADRQRSDCAPLDGEAEPTAEPERVALSVALRWILRAPKLRRMAGLLVMGGVAEAIAMYLFYWIVTQQTPGEDGRAVYFADFYMWLNGGTLAMLLFGSSKIIDRLGLFVALISLPFAMVLGTVVLLVQSTIVVIYGLRIVEGALEDGLYSQAVDRLVVGSDMEYARVVRPLLLGLMGRVGQGLGALLVLVAATGLGASLTACVGLYLAVVIGWAGLAASLRSMGERA